MTIKHIIYFFIILGISRIPDSNGAPSDNKGLIIDIVKNQIEKLIGLVEGLVNTALKELGDMVNAVTEITTTAIKAAVKSINMVIDYSVNSIRTIEQEAVDSGINVTECTVLSIDDLNQLRRRLIGEEILCATNKLAGFNTIVNNTVETFNEDLKIIAGLPKRLTGCLTSLPIHMVKCLTELTADVTQMQLEIPKQIMDAMKDIGEQMVTFEKDVHQCQFDNLKVAVEESRATVDKMTQCVLEANQTQSTTTSTY